MNHRFHKPVFFILILRPSSGQVVRPPQEDCEIYPPEEESSETASGENFSNQQPVPEKKDVTPESHRENSLPDRKPASGRPVVNNNPLNWVDPLGLEKIKQQAEAIRQLARWGVEHGFDIGGGLLGTAGLGTVGESAGLAVAELVPVEQWIAKVPGIKALGSYLAESTGKISAFIRENFSIGRKILTNEVGTINLKTGSPEKLYHYGFSRNADDILENGLRPGVSNGKVFTTPSGDLSPLQAQIDLALTPNRGLPDALFEIDVRTLRKSGIEIPASTLIQRDFNLPGGKLENIFEIRIPPEAVRRVR